ncbi:2100_t:CDS:10 [Ambispora leptoticha]|uniref:2100_t:CDS:1 n=1 Tax=Ambispora leptoticha TaxID=144679 RepID=A0A9N8VFI2_9GLOM|nr:2100_t:CDS:10 [Ambispora leptoticha]
MNQNKRAKPRNFRKKDSDEDGSVSIPVTDVQDPQQKLPTSSSTTSSTLSLEQTTKVNKKKVKVNKPKLALSFENEEEEEIEVFKVTKSVASRKMAQKKSKTIYLDQLNSLPQNLAQATISSSTSYTKEILSELRASTHATPPPPSSFDPQEFDGKLINKKKFDQTNEKKLIKHLLFPKKKREMLRQRGTASVAAPEYISLSEETDVVPSSSKKHPESRLVREEDEIGDTDEELEQYVDEKVALGRKAKKEERLKKKAGIKQMITEAEGEEDEELLQWENEAIKKGANLASRSSIKTISKPKPITAASIPINLPIPSFSEVESRLAQELNNLQDLYKNHQMELTQLKRDFHNDMEASERYGSELQRAKKQYTYFQELKTFVEDLVEFLDAKFPILEENENAFLSCLSEATDMIIKRRLQEDSDDLAFIFGKTDDTHIYRQQLRENRIRTLVKNKGQADIAEEEGLSTDDELEETEKNEILSKIGLISEQHTELFSDVRDEFKSISLIKSKFEEWKSEYREEYLKAYGGLSLPGVFEFYIRYELLLWDPFKAPKQMKASVEIIDQVAFSSSGKDSQKFQDLITSFTGRLTSIVNSIEYDTLSLAGESLFQPFTLAFHRNRYFWRNFKLLANLLLWRKLLPPENLRALIDQLLNRCLLPLLSISDVSEIDKYKKVLELVPTEWMSQSLLEKIARGTVGF